MKKIFLLLIIVTGFSYLCSGQEEDKSQLVLQFYDKLYDLNISPDQIFRDYIVYTDSIGYMNALLSIMNLRQPVGNAEEHFNLLKKDIMNKEFGLLRYAFFEDNEQVKFRYLSNKDRDNVYSISPKHTIKQYILIKGNKIRSFFGFEKTGNDEYTFIVY